MLRLMLGAKRRIRPTEVAYDSASDVSETSENTDVEDDLQESWVDFVKRSTHTALEAAEMADVKDWVILQRERKWRWAGHVARRSDGRWSTALLSWILQGGRRSRGHPAKRWGDEINTFFNKKDGSPKGFWKYVAVVPGIIL